MHPLNWDTATAVKMFEAFTVCLLWALLNFQIPWREPAYGILGTARERSRDPRGHFIQLFSCIRCAILLSCLIQHYFTQIKTYSHLHCRPYWSGPTFSETRDRFLKGCGHMRLRPPPNWYNLKCVLNASPACSHLNLRLSTCDHISQDGF